MKKENDDQQKDESVTLNKVSEDKQVTSEKENKIEIPYSIKTMDSDLKNEKSDSGSFVFSEEKERKEDLEKEKKEIKPQPKPKPQENFNPFLENITPTADDQFNQPKLDDFNSNNLAKEKINQNQKPIVPMPNPSDKTDSIPPIKPVPIPTVPKKNSLEKASEKKVFFNSTLLIFLIVISMIVISSGSYYYFYFNKEDISDETTVITPATKETQDEPEKESLPSDLFETLILDSTDELSTEIINRKETITFSTNLKVEKNSEEMKTSEILTQLNLSLPQEFLDEIKNTWINLNKENDTLKLGIIFNLKNSEKINTFMLEKEPQLPEMFKPLFIDEIFVLQDDKIVFQDSLGLKGVRYYNLVKGFDEKAVDWKILNNKYLLITTSMKTMGDLINDLDTTENSLNSEEKNLLEVENQENLQETTEIETTENFE